MPVVDVTVMDASDILGVSPKKTFCVYVRLQGQAMRTNAVTGNNAGVKFHERFRFQYNPAGRLAEKNLLFVELWTKSFLSQSCVSVAWIDMDKHAFTQGVPLTFNVQGSFETKQATVKVTVLPVDFGTQQAPGPYPAPMGAQFQAPMPSPMPLPQAPAPSYQPQNGPALGIPMQPPQLYTSAQYYPAAQAPPMPYKGGKEDPSYQAPLPPAVPGALPPPLFNSATPTGQQQQQQQQQGQFGWPDPQKPKPL